MTTETAYEYSQRIITRLGQQAHDSQRVAIECYDHPAHKPLPKADGARDKHFYVSRKVWVCLREFVGAQNMDALAESILLLWINENIPDLWSMFRRHEQEMKARLAELRQNEPEFLHALNDRIEELDKSHKQQSKTLTSLCDIHP